MDGIFFLFGRRAGNFTRDGLHKAEGHHNGLGDFTGAWGTSQGPGGLHKGVEEFHKGWGDFTRGLVELHKGLHKGLHKRDFI